MANGVFANGRAISCKAGDGNVTSAFPDVCLSPPSPPAGPVPVPYPLFSSSADTSGGSKSVKISGKEVMLKDKSYFKKCTGNEAATKSLGQGVVTHTLQGKVFFVSWSSDVEFEGENVVRHLDMTTSNHASPMANENVPMVETEKMAPPASIECSEILARFPVESYDEQSKKIKAGEHKGCQSHHVIQNSHFQYPRGTTLQEICPGYSVGAAPCIPLDDGPDLNTTHGWISDMQKKDGTRYRELYENKGVSPTYVDARKDAKKQLMAPKPGPALSAEEAECVLSEVDKHFEMMCNAKEGEDLKLRPPGAKGKGLPKAPDLISGADGAL